MKQMPYKSGYSIAIYTLYLCLLAIGFMLIGNTSPYAKGHEKFKVALLLPASITDGGWNALAYDGLKSGSALSRLCIGRVSPHLWARL